MTIWVPMTIYMDKDRSFYLDGTWDMEAGCVEFSVPAKGIILGFKVLRLQIPPFDIRFNMAKVEESRKVDVGDTVKMFHIECIMRGSEK